jgi:hypothetical protein
MKAEHALIDAFLAERRHNLRLVGGAWCAWTGKTWTPIAAERVVALYRETPETRNRPVTSGAAIHKDDETKTPDESADSDEAGHAFQ